MEYEQLDIFYYLQSPNRSFKPGDCVGKDVLGERLTFDEITQEVGNLIVIQSIPTRESYRVVRVEKIVLVEEGRQRRLVYYDGTRQNGLENEMYFNEDVQRHIRAYRIAT